MHAWEARLGTPVGEHSPEERKKFTNANNLFVGCVLRVLADCLVNVYMHITDAKELWDALVAMYDATGAGSELYTMESFHDFRMVNNRFVVEQTHEILNLVNELELQKCHLPNKFVAGCMIAKLPSSWRNFPTTLKHKRQEISVENLIASLVLRRRLGLRMFLRKEVSLTPAPTWCRRTTHIARTKGRLPTSLSRLLPSRRRRLQRLKELASRVVMGDTSQGNVQTVQIARRRLAMDLDPRVSTR
jgi:hypothetical protein